MSQASPTFKSRRRPATTDVARRGLPPTSVPTTRPITRYGSSYWTMRPAPPARGSYPPLRGSHACDVVVVGGGLTGCLVAHELARTGARVVLLERDRLGAGGTAGDLGIVQPTPGVRFVDLREARGLRAARSIWDASRRAALEWMAFARRTRLRCALDAVDFLECATTTDAAAQLEREYAALKDAGFDASWLPARRVRQVTGAEGEAAMRLTGAGVFDPYRACFGVARLAAKAGAMLCEQSEVTRVAVRRHDVEVVTPKATVTAATVLFASRLPTAGLRALERHFWTEERYVVALPEMTPSQRRRLGPTGTVVADLAVPPHAWRWTADGALLFAGAAQRPVPPRQQGQALVQRTGQLMYELSLHYPQVSGTPAASGWSVPVTTAGDGLPIVGSHRGFPRHLFALGLGAAGVSGAWLAARMLARRLTGASDRHGELFAFGR